MRDVCSRSFRLVLAIGAALAAACSGVATRHDDTSKPSPRVPVTWPSGPLFEGGRPARMLLHERPLGISPDGMARWLVVVSFVDAGGAATKLLHGGNVAFVPSRGRAQWQTRLRFDGPAAIVSTATDGPLSVAVIPRLGAPLSGVHATTDTRRWIGPRVVVRALGPHVVQIGWFPAASAGSVRIARAAQYARQVVATIPASAGTYRDATVAPGAAYRYRVAVPGRAAIALSVRVPQEPAHGSLASLRGKALWLSFSPSELDPDAYSQLHPAALVERARSAGLRAIELRTAYGPYWEVTPAAKPTIDALLDAAAARNIALIGWTIPRSVEYDDLATAVRTALYRTASGHGFAALAVDLERGEEYLGDGASGYRGLTDYLRLLRAALGPRYPLVATVEDPFLEHLTNATYPYAAIAAGADALQPMTYWRMLSKHAVTPQAVRLALRGSYAAIRLQARREIPIDVGGQTSPQGARGAPPAQEITASVREARALGALGITFFDWTGTSDAQWRALGETPW